MRRSAGGWLIGVSAGSAAASAAMALVGGSSVFASFFSDRSGGRVVPAGLVSPSPVMFGGAVVAGSAAYPSQNGDCYIDQGAPSTSFCGQAADLVGPRDHMLIDFALAGSVPSHVQILKSYLVLQLGSQSSTTAESVGVWQAAQPWTSAATWDAYDGLHAWSAPGGDTTGPMEDQQTIGASGDTGGDFYWDVNQSLQGWVDGNPPAVDGFVLEATAGASAPNVLGLDSQSASVGQPYLEIYYEPRMGDYPGARYATQRLTDRSTLGVSVATGNLLVSNADLSLSGVHGLGVQVGRYYNNLSGDQNAFGVGWSMGLGADTYLEVQSDFNEVTDYFDGTGTAQMFYTNQAGQWVDPPGLDTVLSTNGDSTWASSEFMLQFRHTGITETFSAAADSAPKLARLSSVTDRDGNTISYQYNAAGQLTAITDTHGDKTTVSWSAAGYVSEITDPSGRTFQYSQNTAGQLVSYTDPAGKTTHYTYDSYGNLTQIQTPAGNVVNVAYDAGNTNEVTSVQRLVHPSDQSGPTTNFSFGAPDGTACPSNPGWGQAKATSPNGHASTYCTDDLSRLTGLVDPDGNKTTVAYTPDGLVSEITRPSGMPISFSYDASDNLTEVQQGQSDGSPAPLVTKLSYGDSSNPYLPTMVTDPEGNQTEYGHDADGNLTSITDGLASQNTTTIAYNGDGTVASVTGPDADKTSYSYTSGDLTAIVPPAGSGLNALALGYDALHRLTKVSSVSGSAGHEVDYSYDPVGRVDQALYKRAGGSTAQTIGYAFDPDGNLLSRIDAIGTTTYSYDGVDRLTGVVYPDASTVSYAYDADSNLTGVTDAGGSVSYAYDPADLLASITDPGASTPEASFAFDADGNLTGISYASGAGLAETYNALGQPSKVIDTYLAAGGSKAQLSFAYSYAGALVGSVTDQAGDVTSYTYDALNRLTEASIGGAGDKSGNRISYSYD
ncbi:MAG: DUF6531 domain-containing protein, partial [Solirubrobacteraceae bacterium]